MLLYVKIVVFKILLKDLTARFIFSLGINQKVQLTLNRIELFLDCVFHLSHKNTSQALVKCVNFKE